MVLTLVGSPFSTCTKRVATVLHEKQIPFAFKPIDFAKAEHKAPEFVKYQPFGQVPYIDDDGFILYESRAICRYLEAKYPSQGTTLIPKDTQALAKFEQAASIESFNFDPYASTIVWEKVFKKLRGLTTDEAVVTAKLEALDAKLQVYNLILGQQKYLAGDELTMADLFHLPYGTLLNVAGFDVLTKYPNVARWFTELSSRPSWLAVKDNVTATA
ncbi:hypothetical protein ONZ45_g4278 [Pleurotus djamor]|nr:hypothetical protein ONZ45_g4278 [Pleurotus djamor]